MRQHTSRWSYALICAALWMAVVVGAVSTRTGSNSEASLSNDQTETLSLALSPSRAAPSQSTSRPSLSSTTSIDLTSTATARRTPTPSADGTLSGTTSWSLTAASTTMVISETVRLTPTRVSPSVSRASVSSIATLSRTPTHIMTAASLSTTDDGQSASAEVNASSSVSHSTSRSAAHATESNVASPSLELRTTATRSGVFHWAKGRIIDRSYTVTRSPSWGNVQPHGHTASVSLIPSPTPSPSPTASSTHTRSWTSSNFLPGLGANNPLLWFRVTHAFFDDPSMCAPSVLVVMIAPTGMLLVVCAVWAVASRCGYRDPNMCIPEKYTLRAGRLRFMLSHHAYASCIVPCHVRCAPLHALELLSHMSLVLLLLVGFGIAAARRKVPSSVTLVELALLGLCAVCIASTVRVVTSKVGWMQGRRATVSRRRPAADDGSGVAGIVAHGVYAGSSSSDDEAAFPKPYMPAKPKRHKDIRDYVVSYVARRAEGEEDGSSEDDWHDGRQRGVARREDSVVDLRPEEHDEWDFETDSWFRPEEERLQEQSKHAPQPPPPDWLFNVDELDDGPDAAAMTELVAEQFQKLSVQVPKSHTSKMFVDDGLELLQVPVGPNLMRRAACLHLFIWLGAFGGAVALAVDLERAVGRNGCGDFPSVLAVVFVGWDAVLLQSLYALWQGWRQRAWQCCCDIEIDTGCSRSGDRAHDVASSVQAGGDPNEELRSEFALHPLF